MLHALLYLIVPLILLFAGLKLLTFRSEHPWRSTTPLTNDDRYLDWLNRYAEFERQERLRKARQRMRVLRRLDARYANRMTIHTP